jgi:phage portal protein BeeE
MRLLDRVLDRYSLRDAAGYYEGMASGASVLVSVSTDANREAALKDVLSAAQQAYATDGPVFACILIRMMLMAEATFKFRSKVNKHLYGNPSLAILEEPWPNGTTGDLIARMVQDIDLAGNSYWWKAADDLLWRLPPSEVVIVSRQTTDSLGRTYRQVIGYEWDPAPPPPGTQRTMPPQHFEVGEIVHWSFLPDPAANFRGQSWLTPVLRDSYADSALTSAKTRYLDHGQPVAAVKYAAKLRPETVDSIAERLKAKYGGVGNAWQPLILDQGADPIMGTSLQQLDFRAVQAGGQERICSAAGVPPIIVGLKNPEAGETYQAAMRRFGDGTLRPLWRSLCASLQPLIPDMPGQGVQLWYDTADISALQAAETERAQVVQVNAAAVITLVQAGFTRDSVVAAVSSGDLGQLVADPNAPTPGVAERETINVADMGPPETGPGSGQDSNIASVARPAKTGSPAGGGQVLTQPQTATTKKPLPASIPTRPDGYRRPGNPTANGSK